MSGCSAARIRRRQPNCRCKRRNLKRRTTTREPSGAASNDCADLVEVNRLEGNIVNSPLCLAEKFESPDCGFARGLRDIRMPNDLSDFRERSSAAIVVTVHM